MGKKRANDKVDNVGHRFRVDAQDAAGCWIGVEVTINAMGANRLRSETRAMEDGLKDALILLLHDQVPRFHIGIHKIKTKNVK